MPHGIKKLLIVLNFDNSFALVGAAVRAYMMGEMHLAAAFAAHQLLQRECVMRAASVFTAYGMSALWKRAHANTPYNS